MIKLQTAPKYWVVRENPEPGKERERERQSCYTSSTDDGVETLLRPWTEIRQFSRTVWSFRQDLLAKIVEKKNIMDKTPQMHTFLGLRSQDGESPSLANFSRASSSTADRSFNFASLEAPPPPPPSSPFPRSLNFVECCAFYLRNFDSEERHFRFRLYTANPVFPPGMKEKPPQGTGQGRGLRQKKGPPASMVFP